MPRLLPLLALLLVAGLFRFQDLPGRVMHTDEAVIAVAVGRILEGSGFRYDPSDYHGPVLHYSAVPVAKLRGQHRFQDLDETTLRAVPAIYGMALVLLPFAFRRELGESGAWLAAWLTAVSPAMVFFSRYCIMEMPFVLFLGLAFLGAWRWVETRCVRWLVLAAAASGLLHATKETFVIHFAAAAGAWLLIGGRAGLAETFGFLRRNLRVILLAIAGAFALSAILLSDFLRNPRAIWDGVATYLLYLQRAEGGEAGHLQPWFAYFRWYFNTAPSDGFWYSELLVLPAAALGAWRAFFRDRVSPGGRFARWLAAYALLATLAYTIIPYKTPWSYLGVLHTLLLLGGYGIAGCIPKFSAERWSRPLGAAGVLLLAAITAQSWLYTRRIAFEDPANPAQPYVYAHTAQAFLGLVEHIGEIERRKGETASLLVAEEDNGWPLPWYRRHALGHNTYVSEIPRPLDPVPDIVAASTENFPDAAQALFKTHTQAPFPLRPGRMLYVYVRNELLPRDGEIGEAGE